MNKIISFIKRCKMALCGGYSLTKTLYYNYKFFPMNEAVYLPDFIGKHTHFYGNGKLVLQNKENLQNSKIYIGVKALKWMEKSVETVIHNDGLITLETNNIFIGSGSHIEVSNDAELYLGDGFNITGKSTIVCNKKISFKKNVLISWDTLFMDSDAHTIVYKDGKTNYDNEINVGNHVWIGSKSTILSGTDIGNENVIGCNSVVKGNYKEKNCVFAGVPAKKVKDSIMWNIEKPK